MGGTGSHEIGGGKPIMFSELPKWTDEDVKKAWEREEKMSVEARRKRYRAKNYVVPGDFKSWDLQHPHAICNIISTIHPELKEVPSNILHPIIIFECGPFITY